MFFFVFFFADHDDKEHLLSSNGSMRVTANPAGGVFLALPRQSFFSRKGIGSGLLTEARRPLPERFQSHSARVSG